jgi:3-oxoacyl-[acyl-carrier protein] reductase
MKSLHGKVCVVTGGASGLGREIVHQMLAEDAKVVVLDLQDEPLATTTKQTDIYTYRCDVTQEDQIATTIRSVVEEVGKVDILVNNVGILYSAPLVSFGMNGVKQHDSAMWDKVLATNLSSAFYVSKHVVEGMLKTRTKGIIVNISSVSAKGNAGQSAYSAAKAGLEALTKVWAKELGPMGIRCFAVAPGFCDTASTHAAVPAQILDETAKRSALKRLGRPEEIAFAVISGVKNAFLTGKVLEVDGGLVI